MHPINQINQPIFLKSINENTWNNILIIHEYLYVGLILFQHKCYPKTKDLAVFKHQSQVSPHVSGDTLAQTSSSSPSSHRSDLHFSLVRVLRLAYEGGASSAQNPQGLWHGTHAWKHVRKGVTKAMFIYMVCVDTHRRKRTLNRTNERNGIVSFHVQGIFRLHMSLRGRAV